MRHGPLHRREIRRVVRRRVPKASSTISIPGPPMRPKPGHRHLRTPGQAGPDAREAKDCRLENSQLSVLPRKGERRQPGQACRGSQTACRCSRVLAPLRGRGIDMVADGIGRPAPAPARTFTTVRVSQGLISRTPSPGQLEHKPYDDPSANPMGPQDRRGKKGSGKNKRIVGQKAIRHFERGCGAVDQPCNHRAGRQTQGTHHLFQTTGDVTIVPEQRWC